MQKIKISSTNHSRFNSVQPDCNTSGIKPTGELAYSWLN